MKVVSNYEKRLQEMPFVSTFSYGRRMLMDYSTPNTIVFSDQALAISFVPYVAISEIRYSPEEL